MKAQDLSQRENKAFGLSRTEVARACVKHSRFNACLPLLVNFAAFGVLAKTYQLSLQLAKRQKKDNADGHLTN